MLSKAIYKSMRLFCFLLLSVLPFHFPSHASSLVPMPLCNHDDASALLSFKSSFSLNCDSVSCGECESCYPKTKSWENGKSCCLWDGVSCDTKSGQVTGLDLSCSCLQGQFHHNTTLFQLIHLQTLNLGFNDFSNSLIPSGFGDLVALTHLNLSTYDGFRGIIPSKISHLSKLVSLDLSYSNELRIEPSTLEKLIVNATDLRELALYGLNMFLIKPSSLSLLVNFSSSLVSLNLGATELQGELANNLFYLPNLQKLDLSTNWNLKGELPKFNWSTPLRYLDLSYTAFSGPIMFLSNLTRLEYLDLGRNNFSGEIPLSLSNLQHLSYLDLSENNLRGPIPQCLGNIIQLNHLDLSLNNFSGEIPSFLFNLQLLTFLGLSYNNFTGEIPDLFSKLSKLEVLDISQNNLVGQLPSSLFGLAQLHVLDCSNNKLVGSLPDKISGLSNLTYLHLSSNSLNGTIPLWSFSLSSLLKLSLDENQFSGPISEFSVFCLQVCDLSHNNLQGSIPKSMFHQENLTLLSLSSNNFSGLVDFNKFPNLRFLWYLDLSHNKFLSLISNGGGDYTLPRLQKLLLSSCNINSFPKFLCGLKNLDTLDLSNNQIHGRIPKWFNNTGKNTLMHLDLSHNLLTSVGYLSLSWTRIDYIDLSLNMLEGDIPIPPSAIGFFSVSNNKLSGQLSSDICNASSLLVLNLSHNNLTGKLPQCLGTFPHLSILDLQRNNLSGIIPRTYFQIEALQTMNFNGNQLKGPLPWPTGKVKCTQLRMLDLGENNIQDSFPGWLESLQQMQILVLRANRFNGTINCLKSKNSFPMLRVFDISNNNFNGNLPEACIKNFKGMTVNINHGLQYMNSEYYPSYNDSVVITIKGNTFELERILTAFTTIDLSNNRFEGLIPIIIGELKSLKGLNLSHNRITGFIPQTIGALENLEWLDLSSNMLAGEIPMALTNLHFLSILNLSQNQLVGMIPTGKQFDTFQNDSYQGNPGLCGLPLSKSCHKDEKQLRDSENFQHDEQFGFSWKIVAIGYAFGGVFGIALGYVVFFVRKPQCAIRFVESILNQRVRKKNHRSNAN